MWSVSSSLVVVFYNIMSYVVAIQFILLCIKGWLIFIFNILQIQTVWLSEISSTTSNVIENQTQMGNFLHCSHHNFPIAQFNKLSNAHIPYILTTKCQYEFA